MATKILSDIHSDMKKLITAITSFEENEEGFRICEKFCITSIKHHRYLSVDSSTTRETIKALIDKFSIHGKYDVARKFKELVDTFLCSFDFEHHPQYDLQWHLLTLLLELSKETCNSDLKSLRSTYEECTINATNQTNSEIAEEINWSDYLKEGQQDFFNNYESDTESEWSDDSESKIEPQENLELQIRAVKINSENAVCVASVEKELNELSVALEEELKSKYWLTSNVQNTWWNNLGWHKCSVKSKFCDAHLCEIWHMATGGDYYTLGTLSEYVVCKELLWMFYAPEHMVLFEQNVEGVFSVRSDVSIPSITTVSASFTVAFNSILSSFCKYFSMIREMEQFGIKLYSEQNEISGKPPLTYETYNAILQQHLMEFKTKIINIEKRLTAQDSTITLLSLSSTLKESLYNVEMLYDVHKKSVSNWRTTSNWHCASKLLSSLYFEIQKSHNQRRTNICISLYLSSLAVYLNIIDTWLSEGRFEDWREEFIISRLPSDIALETCEQSETFSLRPLNSICLADPIMQFLIRKIHYIGQSIEMLVSLDRITDIWSINIESRRPLVEQFYSRLELEILKYIAHEKEEEQEEQGVKKVSSSSPEEITDDEIDEDIDKIIVQQLSEFHNPFLLKAFEDYLPPALLKGDKNDVEEVSRKSSKADINAIFKRLEDATHYVLPIRKVLANILSDILTSRYSGASKLVKNIMVEEYKLESHLTLMRSVYMMEAGHVMNKFYQRLFHEIETNSMWDNSYFLSCILEEVLSQWWSDSSSRWSVTVSNTYTDKVLIAVDNITLHYAIGWPINVVLSEKTFLKYNEIFRFQLKLKWALWTLNNLRFSDLEGSKMMKQRNKLEQFHIRRIESLRFCLLHAITSINMYLSGQVLQNLSSVLQKSLTQADSLDSIVSVHNEYLRKVHEHCLLTSEYEDLMATINNLIEMCSHVRARWNYKKIMFATEELDILESSYNKYHTYLALALHNAVQNKDANYYELMLQYQIKARNMYIEKNDTSCPFDDLSRSLLIEVAYQYLPPSGLPIPIPKIIQKMDSYNSSINSANSLPNDVTLNEYEQTFSYIRWYQIEENVFTINFSPYILHDEMEDFVDDNDADEDSLQRNC